MGSSLLTEKVMQILKLCLAFSILHLVTSKHVGCYWGTWAYSKFGLGTFWPEDVPVELCDVIYYGFGNVLNNTYEMCSYDPWFDLGEPEFSDPSIPNCILERDGEEWPPGCMTTGGLEYCHEDGIRRAVDLKQKNPNLKVIFSVGGYNAGGWIFSQLSQTEERRLMFIQSVIHFLKHFKLDGLDLDWEYPALDLVTGNPTGPNDKEHLTELVKELRFFFDIEGFLLTGAFAIDPAKAANAYDLPAIVDSFDWFNLMAYDYGGPWDPYTSTDAPLYKRPSEDDPNNERYRFNMNDGVQYYISQGVPPEKISLGLHSEAKAWILDDPEMNGLDCPASPAPNMTYSQQEGWLTYYEILQFFYNETIEDPLWSDLKPGIENWNIVSGEENGCQLSPYAYQGKYWVSYDDEDSIGRKARYANHYGLLGAFIWEIDTDNFKGMFGKRPFTLLQAVNDAIESGRGLEEHELLENIYPRCEPLAKSCKVK